jgi:hypothetical protein
MDWHAKVPRWKAALLIGAVVVATVIVSSCIAAWEESRTVRCRSSTEGLWKAALLYMEQHGGYFFPPEKTEGDGDEMAPATKAHAQLDAQTEGGRR